MIYTCYSYNSGMEKTTVHIFLDAKSVCECGQEDLRRRMEK